MNWTVRGKRVVLAVAACLLLLGAGAAVDQTAAPSRIELLGLHFVESEWPAAKSGEVWWGLFKNGEGFELAETVITVEDKDNGCLDQKIPCVTISDKREPLFLVRGSERFKAGPVQVAYSGSLKLLSAETHSMQLRPNHNILFTLGNVVKGEGCYPVIKEYAINICDESSGLSQELLRVDSTSLAEEFPVIHWIGDLDRDGRLDIYLDSQPYPGGEYVLYLSSEAEKGEILHKVATLWHRSC